MKKKKTAKKMKSSKKPSIVLVAIVKTERDATNLVVGLKRLLQSTNRVIVTAKCQIEGLLKSGRVP